MAGNGGAYATRLPISQASTRMATTLTAAPPMESISVDGRPLTCDRSSTPSAEAISMPTTAAANTPMMARTACRFWRLVRSTAMPGAR